jgi:hypothetical protein
MPPAWLPNWRDPSQYPNDKASQRLDWAWQFLRRNPDYQQMWATLIAPNYNPVHVTRSLSRVSQQVLDRVRPMLFEYSGNYPLDAFQQRFGIITVPLDPSEPQAKLRFAAEFIRYARRPVQRPGKPGWVYNVPAALQDHETLVWFDLRWPIEAQLNRARKQLQAEIKKHNLPAIPFRFRYRPDQYADYLRLLDAQVVGAPDADVAKVIYPTLSNEYPDRHGNHQVREDRATAELLRDNAWRIVAGGK